MANDIEILITGKNLAKAAFAGARTDTDILKVKADEMGMAMRRAGLAAATAGDNAQRALSRAADAGERAAASQKAAATAADKLAKAEAAARDAATANADAAARLAKGEIAAADAEKIAAAAADKQAKADLAAADAKKAETRASADQVRAADASTRATRANERAQLAQAGASKRAGESQAAAAAVSSKSSAAMAAGMEKLRGVGKTALQGLVGGAILVGVESVKMSTKFDAAMTLINTQAGVSKSKIAGLSQGVLKLAGETAQNPDSLAEALFHVESNFASMGITSQKALNLTKIAAEGARVGQADLVDVTNALTAAVASGIPGVQNMQQAMGVLNATVGAGDMKMQDLANAFGSGMVAVVKGYGLSITDVGAALATFGDNNIRGAHAGTMLRMSVQALAVPAKGGAAALAALGMHADTLAKDMQKGGLKLAMEDLMGRFKATGVAASQQGQIITELFGKKAGAGVAVLAGQFDRLKSKYPDIEKGAKGFGSAWGETQKTFSYQLGHMENALKALGIQIGQKLTPILASMMGWMSKHTGVMKVAAAVIGGILLVAIGAYTVSMISAAAATIAATWPVLAVVAAVGLLVAGVIYAYKHFAGFRHEVQAVGKAIQHAWGVAFKEVEKVTKQFIAGAAKELQKILKSITKWWKENGKEVMTDVKAVWKYVSTVIGVELTVIWNVLKVVLTQLVSYWRVVWGIVWDAVKIVWTYIKDFISMMVHNIENVIHLVLDIIHGRWGKVWGDLKKLAGDAIHGALKIITDLAKGFGTLLYDAGKNIIKGLINGIKSMIGAVGDTVHGIVSKIKGFLPFSPAKEGPLSGSGNPYLSGKSIVGLLSDGIADSSWIASGAIGKVAKAVHKGMPGPVRLHANPDAISRAFQGRGGLVHVSETLAALGSSVAGAAGSALNTSTSTARHRTTHHRTTHHHRRSHHYYGTSKIVVEFDFKSGGSDLEKALIFMIRHGVRVRGGNVQAVLGKH